MTNWSDTVRTIPDLAATVRRRLCAAPYALLGSVRADDAGRETLPAAFALFRIGVVDVAWIRLAETRDHHLIDSWRAGEQSVRTRRDHP